MTEGDRLEREIREHPCDANAYTVYADHLQQLGDPRGDLIALDIAAERTPAVTKRGHVHPRIALARHHEVHAATFLGPLAAFAEAFTWRYGFIHKVDIERAPYDRRGEVIEQLLAHPSGKFVTEARLYAPDTAALRPMLQQLAGRTTLRALSLTSYSALGDLSATLRAFPRLSKFEVAAPTFELAEAKLDGLTELRCLAELLTQGTMRAIARGIGPGLQRLAVRFGTGDIANRPRRVTRAGFEDIRALFDRRDLPALRELALRVCPFAGEIVRVLGAAPLARQLGVLDLSFGTLRDGDVAALAGVREPFTWRELWAPIDGLSPASLAQLQRHAKKVCADAQAPRDRLDDWAGDAAPEPEPDYDDEFDDPMGSGADGDDHDLMGPIRDYNAEPDPAETYTDDSDERYFRR